MAAVDPAVARSSATNATRIRSLVADLNGPRYRDIADAAFELGPMVKDDSRAASIVRNAGAVPLLVSACDSVDARVQVRPVTGVALSMVFFFFLFLFLFCYFGSTFGR